MSKYDDIALQLKAGNEEAFHELYYLIEKGLINHLQKMLISREKAEEVFHETLMQMIKKIDLYNPVPTLENSFKAWVFRIGTNLALDEIRKNKRQEQLAFREDVTEKSCAIDFTDMQEKLNALIVKLPLLQRTLLNLRVNEDLTHVEIARICNCHENAVKQGLFRARNNLKKLLIQEGIEL